MVTPPVVEPVSLASAKIVILPDGSPSITNIVISNNDDVNATMLLYLQHGVFTKEMLAYLSLLGQDRQKSITNAVLGMQTAALQKQIDDNHTQLITDLSTPVVDQLVIGSNYIESTSIKK